MARPARIRGGAAPKRPTRRARSVTSARGQSEEPMARVARPLPGTCCDGCSVEKMTSHAIFKYNVLVIDIDNTTLGLI